MKIFHKITYNHQEIYRLLFQKTLYYHALPHVKEIVSRQQKLLRKTKENK